MAGAQLAPSGQQLFLHTRLCNTRKPDQPLISHALQPPHSITMKSVARLSTLALRRAAAAPLRASTPANCIIARAAAVNTGRASASVRAFHGSTRVRGIMPESENPPPKQSEDHENPTVPTDISTSEFHERADEYLNELVERLEEAQEKNPDIEVEYSVRLTVPCTRHFY